MIATTQMLIDAALASDKVFTEHGHFDHEHSLSEDDIDAAVAVAIALGFTVPPDAIVAAKEHIETHAEYLRLLREQMIYGMENK